MVSQIICEDCCRLYIYNHFAQRISLRLVLACLSSYDARMLYFWHDNDGNNDYEIISILANNFMNNEYNNNFFVCK